MKQPFGFTHEKYRAVGDNGRFSLPAEFFAEHIAEQFSNRMVWSRLC